MRKPKLTPEERQLLRTLIADLDRTGRLALARAAIQHGSTTVFAHCVKVACFSLFLANKLHIPVNTHALLRGALLHDYFLYDWHEKNAGHRFHGFTHPATALKNAQEDFMLPGGKRHHRPPYVPPLSHPAPLPGGVAGVRGRQILRPAGDLDPLAPRPVLHPHLLTLAHDNDP